MLFRDREQAAQLLVKKLEKFRPEHPLVLAIPRGAVPMGRIIADALLTDFDVMLIRKISAPKNPEFAIGAVSEFGDIYLSSAKTTYGISNDYIKRAVNEELHTIRQRRAVYTPIKNPISPAGRTVILVDDGIATGATMLSAIRAAQSQKAKRVIVAAPVASQDAASLLANEADEMIFLDVPALFWAIGQFYENFTQVTDDDVSRALGEASKGPARGRQVA